MAKLHLVMALDFKRDKRNKEPRSGQYSYHHDGQWYLVRYGPTYSNTFRVVEYSAEEEAYLREIQEETNKPEEPQ